MVPLRLQLRNFMSYRGDDNEVDFSGLHLASVVGDNGHGKSALLDAITWALWGKSRARRDDDLITQGEKETEVRFEFELNGQRYRVVRRRSRANKRGHTILELQVYDGMAFRPISGTTVQKTQAEINKLLRVDYETFINSAFILQGRADEFTTRPPGKRKEILADILGLGVYDEYAQRARDKAREAEAEVKRISRELEQIEEEARAIPRWEREVEEARRQVEEIERKHREAERELNRLRDEKRALESRAEELTKVERQLRGIQDKLRHQQARKEQLLTRIAEDEAVLDRAGEIEAAYTQLQEARRALERWNCKMRELLGIQQEREQAQRQVDAARGKLERRLHHAQQVVDECQAHLAEAEELAGRREALLREREELEALERELEALQQERQAAQEERVELRTENKRLKEAMDELKERIDLLEREAGARCPVCRQPLSEEHRRQALDEALAEGRELGDRFRRNQERLKELKVQAEMLDQRVEEINARLKRERPRVTRALAQVEQRLEQVDAARRRLEEARAEVERLEQQLQAGDFAHEAQARLAKLDEEARKLGYDRAAHDATEQRVRALQAAEAEWQRLRVARERIEGEREALCDVNTRLQELQQQAEELEVKQQQLREELKNLPDLRRRVRAQEEEVARLEGELGKAQRQLGSAQQCLEFARQQAAKKPAKETERRQWQERRDAFQFLAEAFGKRGLQAMIIESVLPELEDEANRLLALMTDGRMYVQLRTQRETRQGGVVETLDIVIADERGERPYELYSGGEAFRVNFALRIALSKLLARRAGARLQTLFIDEGFGSQDRVGRERLVEAINAIRDEFARIFVITHIEELKDAFPARIDVVKDDNGSRVYVTL